jgi:hypothetical protein
LVLNNYEISVKTQHIITIMLYSCKAQLILYVVFWLKLYNYLTHWGRVTHICVFTWQLCKTDDANLRF